MKAYTKTELAGLMGVSKTTLSYYLNKRWFAELSAQGYNKMQKIIPPRIIAIIREKWGDLETNEMS